VAALAVIFIAGSSLQVLQPFLPVKFTGPACEREFRQAQMIPALGEPVKDSVEWRLSDRPWDGLLLAPSCEWQKSELFASEGRQRLRITMVLDELKSRERGPWH
jgi:hypothetical protein